MSLLNTKPRWFSGELIATESGWVNPLNNEVLVSVGNLKSRLEKEFSKLPKTVKPVQAIVVAEVVKTVITKIEEVVMEINEPKKDILFKKPKLVLETSISKIKKNQEIIAEVVVHDLDKQVIAE